MFLLVPPQSLLPQHNPVQCTHPENANAGNQQEYTQPTQVEDDGELESHPMLQSMAYYQSSFQTTNLQGVIPSRTIEQLHQQNKLLQTEVTFKSNEIHVLSKKNIQLQKSLQQMQSELNMEREMSQQQVNNHEQIQQCYMAQINKLSAQLQGKSDQRAERYLMCNWPHGIAIIINNYEFSSNHFGEKLLPDREGSLADENNLRIIWEYLGYKVQVLKNLKASELLHHLAQVALQSHENYDSFVCCILSHGELDRIYGTDGEPVDINEIVNLFKGNPCPSLVSKPKLFFIQTCRGDRKDEGAEKDGPENSNLLPSEADCFFGYATPPGYVSWRSCEHGSWYISKLCEVLKENSTHQDLLSMSTMVTNKVSEAYTDKGYKQCPAPVSHLRKKVWFFGN